MTGIHPAVITGGGERFRLSAAKRLRLDGLDGSPPVAMLPPTIVRRTGEMQQAAGQDSASWRPPRLSTANPPLIEPLLDEVHR